MPYPSTDLTAFHIAYRFNDTYAAWLRGKTLAEVQAYRAKRERERQEWLEEQERQEIKNWRNTWYDDVYGDAH